MSNALQKQILQCLFLWKMQHRGPYTLKSNTKIWGRQHGWNNTVANKCDVMKESIVVHIDFTHVKYSKWNTSSGGKAHNCVCSTHIKGCAFQDLSLLTRLTHFIWSRQLVVHLSVPKDKISPYASGFVSFP